MATPSYLTTCTKNEPLNEAVFELKLRLPGDQKLSFKAGQFVLFDVPLVTNPSEIQSRAYSIASPPSDDQELTFVIMNKEGGRATRWVAEMLKVGDEVRIQGPFGVFTPSYENPKDFLFVATGTGVAPFYSMAFDALKRVVERRHIHLVFGTRYEKHLFWIDKFDALASTHPNFHLHVALTKPNEKWSGLRGRVTEVIPSIIADFSSVQSYICGSPEMVKDTKEWLFARGMEKKEVHTEGYV
ncbi:MAG TPA: FAD-binding oxidoreductase [Candidatus Peribacterales bacterium]|nr:FAD-binding oxidoreductase [Candidatus Peribacterales bacterium]